MADRSFLAWPFFEPRHRELGQELVAWSETGIGKPGADLDAECRSLVSALGSA